MIANKTPLRCNVIKLRILTWPLGAMSLSYMNLIKILASEMMLGSFYFVINA